MAGHVGHVLFGLLLLTMGTMILSDVGRYLESKLLHVMPDVLTTLITYF